ncbi:hypothetical protein [Paenibacillus thalictri]|uniref:hypothetical protein n=1 Tax=Paenibacillus thalictri TaxID=2527873 RepID=UPI0013EF38C9|nr:hypothetical protein [Paenibacillus thalictri]
MMDKESENMNSVVKRPNTPAESLKESIEQVKLMREGKLPKKSWWDYIKEQKRDN